MKTILIFIFIFFMFIIIFSFATKSYIDEYPTYIVMGKKGSGKSTLIQKLVYQYNKKGWNVYSNYDFDKCRTFQTANFGKFQFPPHSVVFFDEAGIEFNNRDFINFQKSWQKAIAMARHQHCCYWFFSQSYNVDKVIRDLSDYIYIINKYARVFSIARRVQKKIAIHNATGAEGDSKISEDYEYMSLIVPHSLIITFLPSYVKKFDSYYNDNNNDLMPYNLYNKARPERRASKFSKTRT